MSNDTAIASLKDKIDGLNQLAWEVRVNDSPKAFQLSEESVKLARSINYTKGLAEGLRSLGFAYVRLSKNEEAAPLLMESLSLFQSINDIRGQAIAYEYLGIIERNWGNLGASLELLLKGYALIQQVGSVEIEVTSCYQIGVTYKHLGNHENALDYLYKALSIAKSSGNVLMVAYATNIIGSIYFDNGDYEHALDCYQQGLVIRRESHDKWGEAGSLDNIGFTYLKLKDLDKAIDYCKQSLAISQSTGDKKGEANALLHLAEIYEQAGDIKQASKFSNESLAIRKARGDRRGETEALLFLADLHKKSKGSEDDQILKWLSGALSIAEEIKAQDLLSKAYYNLHEYYTQRGDFKASLSNLEAHLQIEKELHKNTIIQKVSNLEISHKAETISQRNKELTDLNEKIEKANAELKIEASLERVRAVAMGMKKPDDLLSICKVLFNELELLGIKELRNAMVNIYNDEKNTFLNYDFSGSLGQSITVFSMVDTHPVPDYITKQIRQAKSPFAEIALSGGQLADWIGFREKHGELPDPKLKNASTLCYYFYSVETAAIGISTLSSITKQEHEILKRFRNVFDLAYKRYTDIKQAEAQVREAQIETGLERVRSKTMAMHKSEEVTGVAVSLNEELLKLGFEGGSTIIIIDRETGDTEQWSGFSEDKSIKSCNVPYFKHPCHISLLNGWQQDEKFLIYNLSGDEKRSFDDHYFSTGYKIFPEGDKKWMREMESVIFSYAFMKYGAIHWGPDHLTEEQLRILQRFAKVFEQSYTRFLDLQKAEAQAREAEIELALERVRARTMAMQKSNELQQVVHTVFERLKELNVDFYTSIIILFTEGSKDIVWWFENRENQQYAQVSIPYANISYLRDLFEAKEAGEGLFTKYYPFEEKNELFHYLFNNTVLQHVPEQQKKFLFEAGSAAMSVAIAANTGIHLTSYSRKSFSERENEILKRFAKVFDQAYTRFLDLQKAEAQVREAKIEAALEKIRSRSLAMHKSDELKDVIAVVFEKLKELGLVFDGSGIQLFKENSKDSILWVAAPDQVSAPSLINLPYDKEALENSEFFKYLWEARRTGKDIYNKTYSFDEKNRYFNYVAKYNAQIPINVREFHRQAPSYTHTVVMEKNSALITDSWSGKTLSVEEINILKRVVKVFEQAYTRFLDLQKAEAQAREAQIELGLERVRARAMAMQKSDELKELIATVSIELSKLDIILDRCFIMIYDIKTLGVTWWMANPETSADPIGLYVKYHEQVPYLAFLKAWQDRIVKWQFILEGSVKKTWDEFLFVETELSRLPDFVIDNMRANDKVYLSASFNNFGCLTLATLEPLSDEQFDIMLRFAKVFDLTYTRFNDLKQAEAQTREARIEAALEKVRASTMAMQRSEDLSQTAFVLFNQFKELGQAPERIFIATFDDHDKGVIDLWGTDQGGSKLNKLFKVPVNEPTMVSKIIAAWKNKKKSVVVDLKGEELKTYLGFLKHTGIPVTEGVMAERRVQTAACFSNGVIGVTTPEPQTAEAVQLQERFAGVFDLTYTRFLDLQKAEEQAREAKIETALERVRARALAMQQPEELKDVAQVLRNEMGMLGVEELETCSIYIHEKDSETAECWYALKDPKETGKKMVSDHFHLELNDTWVGREMKKFYSADSKQTSIVMQGANRKEWINYCYKHSPAFSGFYGETIPDRTYHLYKFSHGYIGAAAPGDISAESWRLLSRAASVFSLAYSRFKDLTQARNDLIKLKEEKKRAEDALTELQATQKQLIQSEKMASLGELTAGIAHEIQNPLNFVNNFSDVSNELLEEMKIELEKGNAEEAKTIAINVKENLEKILHHGKRADAIVKGMLQHSRSSSGQKELTDINTLAEEYLRLSYHGLRAKDKFFNARFETDLDRSISKINIVPQEIGRVILNLINNSFYAVNEKKKNSTNGYEPFITVSTKKVKDKVEIRVKDNGNGIPQELLDKIFQPFFTTKPTGQGTGLGLSLSYDIITKGHDGDIKVKTKEGEGSEFTITLPMN